MTLMEMTPALGGSFENLLRIGDNFDSEAKRIKDWSMEWQRHLAQQRIAFRIGAPKHRGR